MTTTSTPLAAAVGTGPDQSATSPPRATAPVLVATDTSPSSDAALVMARLLAQRCGAPVDVLAVLQSAALHLPAPYPFVPPLDLDTMRMDQLRDRTRHQVEGLVGDAPGWTVETEYGDPAPTIRRMARERGSDLVLMGVSRHGLVDRIFGEETTAQEAQVTAVPLLAVVPGTDRLPRTAVVALGPDMATVQDSATVRALLGDVQSVHFVAVKPRAAEMPELVPASWELQWVDDIQDAYVQISTWLGLAEGVKRELVTLTGDPAKEILRFADNAGADLIIVGQRRRWLLGARAGGGLATRLLRGTTCSVLVLPRPRRGAHRAAALRATAGHTETLVSSDEWPARLDAFSRRNAGRRAMLEVDDAELGAQAQASDYPFLGIDYDRSDDCITIMLGASEGGTSHLTHSVVRPISVDVLEREGKAQALRVENERGQALLTFL